MDEAVACTEQEDEQEDAHRHAQPRQCGAEFVLIEVGKDFLKHKTTS